VLGQHDIQGVRQPEETGATEEWNSEVGAKTRSDRKVTFNAAAYGRKITPAGDATAGTCSSAIVSMAPLAQHRPRGGALARPPRTWDSGSPWGSGEECTLFQADWGNAELHSSGTPRTLPGKKVVVGGWATETRSDRETPASVASLGYTQRCRADTSCSAFSRAVVARLPSLRRSAELRVIAAVELRRRGTADPVQVVLPVSQITFNPQLPSYSRQHPVGLGPPKTGR